MKIYTEIIWSWDDDKGELVQESEKSYDYDGPLTLLGGGSSAANQKMAKRAARKITTYLEYPPSIGAELRHWVSFKGFDFRDNFNTLDIALYIPPDALGTSYKSDYEAAALGQALGMAQEQLKASGGSLLKLRKNMEANAAAKGSVIVDLVAATATPANLKTALGTVKGQVANPYIVAAYKGPNQMREHKFSFKMMPEDAGESAKCVKIANAFKEAMLPAHVGGDNQTAPSGLFGYPDEFEISFTVNGRELPKTGANPMFNIGRSVLTNCELSYTTQDTVLFFEGTQYPVTISMSLSFMEIEIMHRSKIQNKGL
jgi:hypothetical protein